MKFGILKFGFCRFIAACLFAIGLMASEGFAQNLDIFSTQANGTGFQRQLQQAQQNAPATPNISNFLKDDVSSSTPRNPLSELLKLKQKQVDRPNLFQRFNSKSKEFFDKTKGWAKGRGAEAKEKSNDTWNNVIRDFKANEARLRQQAAQPLTLPAQPSFRTAESIGEPKLRF